jgi:sugar lactone lactonase YvrE
MFARVSRHIAALAVCAVTLPAIAQYRIETVAGGALSPTSIQATQASMGAATGCAIDSTGNVYFSSASEGTVFEIDKSGVLTQVASAAPTGLRLPPGSTPVGPPLQLNSPQGLAFDKTGDLYIAESGANRVLKLSPDGKLTTVAGNGVAGYAGDGGLASSAQLNHPTGLAIDSAGNLYIADQDNYRVRMVSTGGAITTVAGNGQTGPNYGGPGDGGQAINGEISFAGSVAVDSHGNLYIADRMNSRVRVVTPNGVINTFAGSGSFGYGGDNGQAKAAQLNQPSAVAVDASGNLYIADSGNNRIRMVTPGGTISTVAGTTQLAVWGVTTDSNGDLYLYGGDSRIRKISAGTINTIEGGVAPTGSAAALQTQLQYPEGLTTDANGNLYFAEAGNHVVRRLGTDGTLTVVAGNGTPGYSGDGGSATSAQLNSPAGVAIDSSGNLYISDSGNNVVRQVTPDHTIHSFAGSGTDVCPGSDSPTATQLLNPAGLAVDSQGNLYIADSGHGCVLEITPAGQVSTIAGGNAPTSDVFLSDQTTANATTLYLPQGVAVDSTGDVYIADTGNACIRKVMPDGTIAVVAGNGVFGYGGDDGAATGAQLSAAWSVAVDASDNLYIADTMNQRVRRVATDGTITTIAGNGTAGYSGDGGDGTCAELNTPWSVAVGSNGAIYISDWGNGAIRELTTGTAEAAASGRSPRACGAERVPRDGAPALLDAALSLTDADSRIFGRGLPPFRPDSMRSAAGDTYSPGPDPDFSYLPLLQPNLLFVQDIQRYVDLANSLGVMADSMQGPSGASLLAFRAQVLQYAGTHAWVLMMQDAYYAKQEGWQPAVTYQTALGYTFPFYDAFLPSATGDYFTASDLASLKQYLDELPPALLQYWAFIVNGPVTPMTGFASDTWEYPGAARISMEGIGDVYNESLAHENGVSVFIGLPDPSFHTEWDTLWNESTDPAWDCADANSGFPTRPVDPNYVPWGDTDEVEDFATVYSDWAGDSATPRLNPNQSSSILEQAVYAASQGHIVLLPKTLLVAALFTDPSTLQLSLYYHQNYQWPLPISLMLSTVQVSPTSLTVGEFTFAIQNGALTSVTSPASQVTVSGNVVNIPALSWTFPTPVPIPAYAATTWGISQ